jgi:hypothetical protein
VLITQWHYFSIGDEKKAIKLFADMLKLKKEHKVDKQMVRDRIKMEWFDIILIWSRTNKKFFVEIWIENYHLWSFYFTISNFNIYKQAQYFSRKIENKKDVFEKIMSLYPISDQNDLTDKAL